MSPAQKSRHWRDWGKVAKANGWRMLKSRLVDADQSLPDGPRSRDRSQHHARVWTFAEQRALREHRSVTADDLRHACYVVAAGRDCSHVDLTNQEFNRLLALFALLVDPDNLNAVMEWENPDLAARRGLIASVLKNAPGEAYVIAIAKRKHGTADWRALPDWALRNMAVTLSNRARKERAALATSADPF